LEPEVKDSAGLPFCSIRITSVIELVLELRGRGVKVICKFVDPILASFPIEPTSIECSINIAFQLAAELVNSLYAFF
jgi:hypothetical protein